MNNILQTIALHSKERVKHDKNFLGIETMQAEALKANELRTPHQFRQVLATPGLSFICEVKKSSPSKGTISEEFPYLKIALDYETGGADCLSCLTEPKWFGGSDQIFRELRAAISIPMLRKDFIVDPYQIYQAKVLGADAVLLICSLLNKNTLAQFLQITAQLGMDALVEAHSQDEIKMALDAGASIIGVNNRNLKDFTVDLSLAEKLRTQVPENILYVAESGVKSPEDVVMIRNIRADAVLIGEALMRAPCRTEFLKTLKKAAKRTAHD